MAGNSKTCLCAFPAAEAPLGATPILSPQPPVPLRIEVLVFADLPRRLLPV